MQGRRVFLLERDRIDAAAIAALIEQSGHQIVGPANSLDSAMSMKLDNVDFALLERDLGDGTDATPIAERLSAAGVPYAFIIQSGDRADPSLFPGAAFIRRPLTRQSIDAVLAPANAAAVFQDEVEDRDPLRETEIDLIKAKLAETAAKAGPVEGESH